MAKHPVAKNRCGRWPGSVIELLHLTLDVMHHAEDACVAKRDDEERNEEVENDESNEEEAVAGPAIDVVERARSAHAFKSVGTDADHG